MFRREFLKNTALSTLAASCLCTAGLQAQSVQFEVSGVGSGQIPIAIAPFAAEDSALLTDPQTSGGLLVSCAADTVDAVLATFRGHGFEQAAVVGRVVAAAGAASRLLVN